MDNYFLKRAGYSRVEEVEDGGSHRVKRNAPLKARRLSWEKKVHVKKLCTGLLDRYVDFMHRLSLVHVFVEGIGGGYEGCQGNPFGIPSYQEYYEEMIMERLKAQRKLARL